MDANHLQPTTTNFEGYRITSPFSTAVDDHRERARAQLPNPLSTNDVPDGVATTNVWGLNVDPWRNGSSTPIPSEKARGKRRARTPDLESPQVGPSVILEDRPPGSEIRTPQVGVKRARSPGPADTGHEKRARTDDKHPRRKNRSRGPPKVRRPDGPSGAPPAHPVMGPENAYQSGPIASRMGRVPIPGPDHYDITIQDAPFSAMFASSPPKVHLDTSGRHEDGECVTCAGCKDLSTGLHGLLSAVEDMRTGLNHMRDELHVMRVAITQSQPVQATESAAQAAAAKAAKAEEEMRPATDQQDRSDEDESQFPGAYSGTPVPASVPLAAEGEVNVHVARGRKVAFMLL